ncbi:hypothetical protein J5N97_014804 [Dioscorea zingiberensis]|uniref:Exonuclease V n=1 Tax=Dioscorea zingiberensis TaxID=325984 RepID=A0A9D5CVZ8_9LILI|nr:hypothetical protein J5N97_014804 [Dioscorea zingiberensis]
MNTSRTTNGEQIPILVEIISEEEMAFLEAALSSAHPRFSPHRSRPNSLSSQPYTPKSHARTLRSSSPTPPQPDIEDSTAATVSGSPLLRFRSRRALAVTDITATEWCEKQMEFVLLHGRPKRTEAMVAGSVRHAELEEEVVEKVEIQIKSIEESWALKFMNFIVGANQLLFEGLTRELPVIGVVEDTWMIGIIDELQMPVGEISLNPCLIDTKTRYRATLPSEAQKRNARLQLMCYKYLWDTLVANNFPTEHFFNHFGLNPQYPLSEDIRLYTSSLGFEAKTFEEVVFYFRNTCRLLSPCHERLLLRYELQSDRSILEEYEFSFDAGWFKNEIQQCLKFWRGEREASYVSKTEQWKCQFCKFTAMCPRALASNNNAE